MDTYLRATLPDQEQLKQYEQMVLCREFEEAGKSVKASRDLLVCSYDNEEKSNKGPSPCRGSERA